MYFYSFHIQTINPFVEFYVIEQHKVMYCCKEGYLVFSCCANKNLKVSHLICTRRDLISFAHCLAKVESDWMGNVC